ncbi:MAG: M23 family metallopeptidase [Clostridiales bacterium]|nr:M23 family metallopeptidase [Clostridiales bacterium]
MNRPRWNEWITKRSTIWTLSLCLVGVIVLGGIAAVDSSRDNGNTQSETEFGQIAYLEEDLELTEENPGENNPASQDTTAENTDGLEEVSGNTVEGTISGTGNDETIAGVNTDGTADTDGDSTLSDAGSESNAADTDIDGALSNAGSENNAAGTDGENSLPGTDHASEVTGINTDNNLSGTDSENEATASDNESNPSDTNSEEASSSSIISEQALIDAGVSFTDEESLLWPSAGTIAIDYSMDKSVYFATLNQYKYNPALIISSDSGNQVLASAKGIVESISVDEETGTTLVLNVGNGYKLTYGQLMEPAVSEGDVVEAGDLLAYISEPTKYYSTEGSNLYFAMTKDGEPVDPILYLE